MKRLPLLIVLAVALVCVLAAPALAGPQTFVVAPSAGHDDTAALQQAFDAAAAAGPGSVVKLTKGKFYTNEIVVDGFDGCFKGAGMDRTVIDTLRGYDPLAPGVGLAMDPLDETAPLAGWTSLIAFVCSDVRVADMSFDITAAEPSARWWDDWENPWTHLSDVFIVTRDSCSSFDRVGFAAHDGDLNGFNVDGAAAIYDTSGTHRVTRCSFQGGNDALETGGITGGTLIVGGRPGMGNISDLAGTSCYMTSYSDSRVEISYNRMSSRWGESVTVMQGVGAETAGDLPPLPAPQYFIHDNSITAGTIEFDDGSSYGAGGVLLEDDSWMLGEPSRLRAVVSDNCITLANEGLDGGVNGVGAEGVSVLFNRIRGTGIAGIDAGADIYGFWGYPWGPGCNWRIIGNDVSKVRPVNNLGGSAAQIWLGEKSSHCLVIGGCARTEVLDEGADNVLIHVTELVTGGAARSLGAARASVTGKALTRSQKF
jgi:hypothetical protein